MNKRHEIIMEVITPLSVGAGTNYDWVRGVDCVIKDGRCYVFDFQKFTSLEKKIDKISQLLADSNEVGICNLLDDKLNEVSKYVFDIPVSTTNPIKTFIRTNGKPYIPGSSLKGALRSALTNYLIRDLKVIYKSGRFTTPIPDKRGKIRNEDVFGNVKEGEDIMRFIQVGDIEMTSTELLNTKIFNLQGNTGHWRGGWKHAEEKTTSQFSPEGFNTIYECVIPKMKSQGIINFAGDTFDLIKNNVKANAERKQKLIAAGYDPDLQTLFHIINQHTLDYLKKELAFFKSYHVERSDEIENCINTLICSIESANDTYCILKMAAGSGYHAITGDWKYSDYTQDEAHIIKKNNNNISIPYKSRKTVEYNGTLYLMGFVKLTILQ